MKLHYPSDVTDFIIGQVVGPDTAKGFSVCKSAYYQDGKTTAHFRPISPQEFETCVIDVSGFLRLPSVLFGPDAA